MGDEDWYVESRGDDRIVLRKRASGGGGVLALVILGAIVQFITENWVYIVIVLGVAIVCVIVCFVIYAHAYNPGLKIFFAILVSLALIAGVIYFGPKIAEGSYANRNSSPPPPQISESPENPAYSYAYIMADGLNVRSGPSAGYSVVGRLYKNERVRVMDNSGLWWKVKSGDLEGYVNSKYLRY
ncbi:MAG: SH3 domain-containing protein [Treponema sp.]|nr:SH3 domain-containing protein [Treponema sp.]